MSDRPPPPIVAVVGVTASGKTGLSLDLAEALDGEIVNTDAMQVYRGMDVGTAKLPPADRRGIVHHLLDTRHVRETATVAEFARWARETIDGVRAAGRTPVLVGGSALYVRAILDRFAFAPTDPALRARLEAELADVGPVRLHARLTDVDPAAAAVIEPGNGRRVVRALEVVELTGAPFAASLPEPGYADPRTVQIGVAIDRPTLDTRIAERVDLMLDGGLVEEVRRLLDDGLAEGRTASRAIGYPEITAYLEGGLTLAEARERIVVATRRFARRQEAWWRRDDRIRWVPFDADDRLEQALAVVAALDQPRVGKPVADESGGPVRSTST